MRKAFLITCAAIAALVEAGAWWLWYCNVGSVPADIMQADVQISAGRFSVTNNNRFDWKNVTVVLDGADGDYSSSFCRQARLHYHHKRLYVENAPAGGRRDVFL